MAERWRVGRTTGGRLGIWTSSATCDEPDVCSVAAVPSTKDQRRALLLAAAPRLRDACRRALSLAALGEGVGRLSARHGSAPRTQAEIKAIEQEILTALAFSEGRGR